MADPASSFTAVDLSRLPAPAVIEELSFEAIYADKLARLQAAVPDFDATVESDPAVKLLQIATYDEMIFRQRVNDAARAMMPAFAIGADLDHLAALMGVARITITPADEEAGTPAVMESDTDLRRRLVLAPEGYSVAGPSNAYIFHALSAHADVLDAGVSSPSPGAVVVTILSRLGNGAASAALISAVSAYVSDETRRPLTDFVTVQSAAIVTYAVTATLTTFAGPDAGVVLAEARRRLDDYVAACHRIGRDVTRSGIFAALHAEGVHNVALASPAADIIVSDTQAPYCTAVTLTHSGVGE